MLPNSTGIGLKAPHYDSILQADHGLEWFELHPENYMGAGGVPHKYLTDIRADYQISMHGVGMSLGSATGVDPAHLQRLKALVDRYQPAQVSEHIAWSHLNGMDNRGIFHNDLLPLPYTPESLEVLCNNIDLVQTALGCQILVENPSTYLSFNSNEMPEPEYISEVQKRTGCGLLLDVNNVYVSANNNDFSTDEYIDSYPLHAVAEIHLAGHSVELIDEDRLLIDDHGSPVTDAVWALYSYTIDALERDVPVLIEWDTDVPDFDVMIDEARKASALGRRKQSDACQNGLQASTRKTA